MLQRDRIGRHVSNLITRISKSCYFNVGEYAAETFVKFKKWDGRLLNLLLVILNKICIKCEFSCWGQAMGLSTCPFCQWLEANGGVSVSAVNRKIQAGWICEQLKCPGNKGMSGSLMTSSGCVPKGESSRAGCGTGRVLATWRHTCMCVHVCVWYSARATGVGLQPWGSYIQMWATGETEVWLWVGLSVSVQHIPTGGLPSCSARDGIGWSCWMKVLKHVYVCMSVLSICSWSVWLAMYISIYVFMYLHIYIFTHVV